MLPVQADANPSAADAAALHVCCVLLRAGVPPRSASGCGSHAAHAGCALQPAEAAEALPTLRAPAAPDAAGRAAPSAPAGPAERSLADAAAQSASAAAHAATSSAARGRDQPSLSRLQPPPKPASSHPCCSTAVYAAPSCGPAAAAQQAAHAVQQTAGRRVSRASGLPRACQRLPQPQRSGSQRRARGADARCTSRCVAQARAGAPARTQPGSVRHGNRPVLASLGGCADDPSTAHAGCHRISAARARTGGCCAWGAGLAARGTPPRAAAVRQARKPRSSPRARSQAQGDHRRRTAPLHALDRSAAPAEG
jgi:hypothetical protein